MVHLLIHSFFSYESQYGVKAVMHWIVFSQNSYVEILTPKGMGLEVGPLGGD